MLVVGAGTAGYFAAASAAESGAKVLLIEKSASGNSVRSSALGAVGSRQQDVYKRQVLKRAKGYYGAKSRSYRAAKEQVQHSLQYLSLIHILHCSHRPRSR